jgi:hypothetical protein
MCECRKQPEQGPPPDLSDEEAKALIGIARQVAIDQMAEIVRRVLDAALIDDRTERLQAIAAVCVRYDLERQHRPANGNNRASRGGLRG